MEQVIPSRIVTHIYEDRDAPNAEYFPWFFTVDAYPDAEGGLAGEPIVIDYGAVATRTEAEDAVRWALAHREKCDNPEYG